jgi:hypothetical protein
MYLYHLVLENGGDAIIDSNPDSLTGKIRDFALKVTNFTPRKKKKLERRLIQLEKLQSSVFP